MDFKPTVLIFFFLLLTTKHRCSSSAAQGYRNITRDAILTPSTRRRTGDFAFGFRPLESDPSLFLLAVWFANVPNHTVVWFANVPNHTVVWFAAAAAAAATTVRNGSAARLSPGGQLALLDDAGQEVWSTGGAGNATSVAILDSGDLVLTDAGGGVTWKSFDQPTDTILPSQTLTSPAQLFSRLTDDDYTRGRFELALEDDGDLAFYPLAFPTPEKYDSYWNSSTAGSGARLVFNHSGAGADSVFLSLKNGSTVSVASPTIQVPQSNYYQRATLDPDGVFRHYFFSRDDYVGGWKAAVSLPSNPCDRIFTNVGSGACGFNSYCTLGAESRVDCRCPPHYSFFDPSKKHAGCKPDFPLPLCDPTGDETNYSLEPLPNVDWPLADADRFSPMNESDCADYCLSHCLCLAAVYKSDTCYIKKCRSQTADCPATSPSPSTSNTPIRAPIVLLLVPAIAGKHGSSSVSLCSLPRCC